LDPAGAGKQPRPDGIRQSGPGHPNGHVDHRGAPAARPRFGGPTQSPFRAGEDRGFGLGGILPDPTAFEGAHRIDPVLQTSRFVDNISVTARYGVYLNENSRLMFTAAGGPSNLAGDLDYSFQPEGMDGYFSAYLNHTRSLTSSFLNGNSNVGLPGSNDDPWVYRTSTGFGYTTDPNEDLIISSAVLYERVSIHDGMFSGRERPFDILGNPLTVNPRGSDRSLWLRNVGLHWDLDDRINPRDGTKLRWEFAQGIPVGRSQIDTTRLAMNFTKFTPVQLFGDDTLIFNMQAGTQFGVVAPYEAYNMGGAFSVRGYDLGELGGGRSFFQSTLEYRHPLGSMNIFGSDIPFRVNAFVDYGTAFGTQNMVFGQPAVVRQKPDSGIGYGGGIQALTDFGLLRAELGFAAQGRYQFYFSIGDRY
jgi:outer membrane protein insertion porin family